MRLGATRLIAMIASMPLLSWGSSSGILGVEITGAAPLMAGMVLPAALRYLKTKEEGG